MQITKRQEKILQIIVEQYAFTAQPISSQEIISEHLDDISSATVRNEMVILEKKGLLEKTHTSSGRIPSVDAYKYYEANILKPKINNDVKKKLKKIFALRDLSIDTVIDQSISIINESLKLPSVISSTVNIESLKRFDLIQISADTALIIIVTSSGEIIKNEITLDNASQLADVSTCIRIFNDRLLDTPIKDVSNKLSSIKEIIRTAVHEYEFCIQQIFEKIFSFNTNNSQKRTVVGTKYLTAQPEFRNIEKLNEALGFLENTNVWKHISYNQSKTGKTLITFGRDFGINDIAVASTNIDVGDESNRQISIVGPTRMDYNYVKGLLDFVKEELEAKGGKK